jgi:hypothetical protein
MSKMQEAVETTIGGTKFYIRPFRAFKAVNVSAQVIKVLAPVITPLLSAVTKGADNKVNSADTQNTTDKSSTTGTSENGIFDVDLDSSLPQFIEAFNKLDGNECERILRELITKNGNIGVEFEGQVVPLTDDILDEVFCQNVQNVFVLAFQVIKVNYKGFFSTLGNQYGNLAGQIQKTVTKFNATEN